MIEFAAKDYKGKAEPIWCPGCGDFGVLSCLYNALSQMRINPKNLVFVSGIGCSSRLPGFVNSYGFHTIHGRVLPVASGVKLANPELTVIGVGGDGDGFSIGAGHFPHAARRNINITYIIMDNSIYGLTKGQVSPTSPVGHKTGSTPYGNLEEPINPIAMAIAYNVSFVARGYSGRPAELIQLMVSAVEHKGFSFIDVISPCAVFYNTYKDIPNMIAPIDSSHDVKNREKAFELALGEKLYLGVFYKVERHTFEEGVYATIKKAESRGIPKIDEIAAEFI